MTIFRAEEMDTNYRISKFSITISATARYSTSSAKRDIMVTSDILDPSDERRALKENCSNSNKVVKYSEINKRVKKMTKEVKKKEDHCETNLRTNNSKKVYQLVKTSQKRKTPLS